MEKSEEKAYSQIFELLADSGMGHISEIIKILLNESMKLERSKVLAADPYERTDQRQGYSNGYKPKTLNTRFGRLDLQVPQTRDCEFYPSILEKGIRSERALKLAVAEMYVQGVSTRRTTEIMKEMCGTEISSSEVSRCSALLDDELELWRRRQLGEIPYLYLDARYEKIRSAGCILSHAVLLAVGVRPDGRRSVLGVAVAGSEAEINWREFLSDLHQRGIRGLKMIISDDHQGLRNARNAVFPAVPWQRCQFHLQQNASRLSPKISMRKEIARDIRYIYNSYDRAEADRKLDKVCDKYSKSAPKLSEWLGENLIEGFTMFDFPDAHRVKLRTSNMMENLSRQISRRTKVASIFPNEKSLLRLVSAVLAEIDEDWQAGQTYIRI